MPPETRQSLISAFHTTLKAGSVWGAAILVVFQMGTYYKGLTNRLDTYDRNFIDYKQKNNEQDAALSGINDVTDNLDTRIGELQLNFATLQTSHKDLENDFAEYLHIHNRRH